MATKPITVLLFEDDEGQALLTREALEKEGFIVETSPSGREGLQRLFNQEFHVFLIDMKLPDTSGVEVLRRIMTMKPGAVSIIVTGHGDEVAAVEAMKLGAYDYVVKSPSMGHLAALPMVIREGLERRHLKDERELLQAELWEQARLLEERNAELRRANEELKRLDQVKSDLVSMVSHELRTPLATIKEFTAILADQIAGPVTPSQQEYLGIVTSNVERLSRIIDDLLDMAKIEAGRVMLHRGFVDPSSLVGHVLQSMRPLAESKQLQLEARVREGISGVFADADRITQVLVNLLSNAVKFTAEGGRLTVGVEEQANEVQFSVTDSGCGIAPEDLPKLFEKFQQFRRGTGTGAKGTGLGLAISKRLVELHGGRIWVNSIKGAGSTFSFSLPKYHVEEVFREYLKTGLEHAKRQQHHFSIIVVGVQNFQELKALYGLEETSRLLKELEGSLKETVRRGAGDIVIRWQRGEMVVVLAEVDRAGSDRIAERIARAVASQQFTVDGAKISVPVVTATATYPEDAKTDEELLKVTERQLQRTEKPKTSIMIVDDEPKIRQFLKEALELREYEVVAAANGPDALEQLKHRRVDLVLLDLMMPVMNGYEVYHILKEDPKTKDTPVIIITAKGERKDRELGMDTSTYNYIAKPFQLEDLIAKVREVLVQSKTMRR